MKILTQKEEKHTFWLQNGGSTYTLVNMVVVNITGNTWCGLHAESQLIICLVNIVLS